MAEQIVKILQEQSDLGQHCLHRPVCSKTSDCCRIKVEGCKVPSSHFEKICWDKFS